MAHSEHVLGEYIAGLGLKNAHPAPKLGQTPGLAMGSD